ncbi:Y4yA family PLP-dependent enzyme [uncultured Marixanthomonas sp.]|uniref:Y4yA family PLP-dependent enzyme n=1 Tax=uncultured Marixanthomonas sp. TaxID=757245 RepID=UPI0030DCC35B|tara:strand:- start:105398 stop:106855 length:1458 start_codon:yes stop_codon:yes gene_type:complete
MKNNIPTLEPITSPWIDTLTSDFELQNELLDTYNSPLNIHHIRSFQKNITEYTAFLKQYDFKSKVFYARKANKCSTLATVAFESGIGVDTASYAELKQCLDLNINPEDLVLTAAIKNTKLLRLAIQHEVLIIIDNKDEADLIYAICKEENKQAIIGLRISGFEYNSQKLKSRFGFDIDTVSDFILKFFEPEEVKKCIKFTGFHFHLDGYNTQQRGVAIHQTLDLIENLKTYNFKLNFIDIGGGILINYLKDSDQWKTFQEELKKAILEKRNPITYNNNGLGFVQRDGKIEGQLATYPYYNQIFKTTFIKNILDVMGSQNEPVWKRLKDLNIELRLEPGRSLLDQVGITMAKVAHRKKDADGNILIGLEMNMTQMTSSSADFLLEPKMTYAKPDIDKESVAVFFTGAYCLERDFILKRKIKLPKLPEVGDIVTFINTAGYMMHFFETEAHLFKLSQNIFLKDYTRSTQIVDFFRDENNLETNHIYL